jgi:hypothetical protein
LSHAFNALNIVIKTKATLFGLYFRYNYLLYLLINSYLLSDNYIYSHILIDVNSKETILWIE